MQIVADNKIPFLKGVLEPFADIVYLPGPEITKKTLLNADALLVRSVTKCDVKILEGTKVKFIATATIGNDHIDKEFCGKNNISWFSAKGCNASAVEQYVLAALLCIAQKNKLELKNLTIGIIGVGNIGSRIQKISELLGMKVLLNDPPRAEIEGDKNFTNLDYLLNNSDIVTLHVPLNYSGKYTTYHLADDEFLKKIKHQSIFINTSRGEVVDSNALKSAITKGKIKSSIIDVWENEPDIDRDLINLSDITTPHIAGYSVEGKANATSMIVKAVCDYFNFGLNSWYPLLNEKKINKRLDCTGLSELEILDRAVKFSYKIIADDNALRTNPEKFAELRSYYDFRKEFGNYNLKLINCKNNVAEKLEMLGFMISY